MIEFRLNIQMKVSIQLTWIKKRKKKVKKISKTLNMRRVLLHHHHQVHLHNLMKKMISIIIMVKHMQDIKRQTLMVELG